MGGSDTDNYRYHIILEYLTVMNPVITFTSKLDVHEVRVYSHDEAVPWFLGDEN